MIRISLDTEEKNIEKFVVKFRDKEYEFDIPELLDTETADHSFIKSLAMLIGVRTFLVHCGSADVYVKEVDFLDLILKFLNNKYNYITIKKGE